MAPMKFTATLLCFLVIYTVQAQRTDKRLQKEIESLMKGFNGEVGLYVKNLRTGRIVAIDADTLFPTASMIKVPIAIALVDKINRGELDYHQVLQYKDS